MNLQAFSMGSGNDIPISHLSADAELARDVQAQLGLAGLLDPPVDGQFGPVSQWALAEFCRRVGLEYDAALSREIAVALLAPNIGDQFPLVPGDDLPGRIVEAMRRLGYWLSRHPDCCTIVYIEGMNADGTPNGNKPNVFNDMRLLLRVDNEGVPALAGAWEATTEPGRPFTEHPENPQGAARIAFAQFKSWAVGMHRAGTPGAHEALTQVAKVSVYRDLNKDFSRAGDTVDTGLFGINQHWGYDQPVSDIGIASAGCLVGRSKDGHRAFIAAIKADARYLATTSYRFMTAILPVSEVQAQANTPASETSPVATDAPPPLPPTVPAVAAGLNEAWIETALKVTGHFEDSSDPLGAVTGDFDGQGISLGVLQWNIGQGSLQPLVRSLGRARVVALLPHLGTEFWTACTSNISGGLAIVRGWQPNGVLPAAVKNELRNFTASPEFVACQIEAARSVAKRAFDVASEWAPDLGLPHGPSKALFCWFFDLFTQNGGLKTLTFQDVQNFVAGHGEAGAVSAVCAWLAGRPPGEAGQKDGRKNAELWAGMVTDVTRPLFILSFLRSQLSTAQWRTDALNRKGTIALANGWVHAELHNLSALLSQ